MSPGTRANVLGVGTVVTAAGGGKEKPVRVVSLGEEVREAAAIPAPVTGTSSFVSSAMLLSSLSRSGDVLLLSGFSPDDSDELEAKNEGRGDEVDPRLDLVRTIFDNQYYYTTLWRRGSV